MSRMLRFGGPNLPQGLHTWFENHRGAIIQAYPGQSFLVAEIFNPDYYVDAGFGSYEGEEDGSTGKTSQLVDDLRLLVQKHEIAIVGEPDTWSLDTMIEAMRSVKREDDEAIAEHAAAEAAAGEAAPLEP